MIDPYSTLMPRKRWIILRFTLLITLFPVTFLIVSCHHHESRQVLNLEKSIDSNNKVFAGRTDKGRKDIPAVQQIIETSDSLNYLKGYVESSIIASIIYFQDFKYQEGMKMLETARKKAEKENAPDLLARIDLNIGKLYFLMNNIELSYDFLNRAAENFRSEYDTARLTETYRQIATLFLDKPDWTHTRKYLWLAYLLDLKSKNEMSLANDFEGMGVFFSKQNMLDSSAYFLNQAYRLFEKKGEADLLVRNYINRAGLKIRLQKGDEAEALLNIALRIADTARTVKILPDRLPVIYGNLGIIYMDRKQFAEAKQLFEKALAVAQPYLNINIPIGLNQYLSQCNRELKNFEEALAVYDRYTALKDSNFTLTIKQNLNGLEMKYNFEKEQKEQEIKQQKLRLFFAGSVVLSGFIIVLLVLFIQKQRIKMKNSRLEKKMLDEELARRNRELAAHVLNMVRINERKLSLIETLKQQIPNVKKDNQEVVQKVIEGLESDQDAAIWKEFELRFTEVHREFYEKLSRLNPNLTLNEKRLCAFLLLDMSSKEISSITGQSLRALEQARFRLRKQLGLVNQEVSLSNFLSSL